jgi:long-chain acyl-CoA synthetase
MMVEMSVSPPIVTSTRTATLARRDGPTPGAYGRVAAWLSKRVEVALTQVDLTLPQYRVLGILAEGSNAASGLAGRLAVRPPSVTALIDGLVARDLVERKQEEGDRRRIALCLTPAGVRIVAEADLMLDAYITSIAATLPGEDEAVALGSLELWGHALSNFHQQRTASP